MELVGDLKPQPGIGGRDSTIYGRLPVFLSHVYVCAVDLGEEPLNLLRSFFLELFREAIWTIWSPGDVLFFLLCEWGCVKSGLRTIKDDPHNFSAPGRQGDMALGSF